MVFFNGIFIMRQMIAILHFYRTPIYFGGVNRDQYVVASGVGVDTGFRGCISDIVIGNNVVDVVKSYVDSSNIEDCSTRYLSLTFNIPVPGTNYLSHLNYLDSFVPTRHSTIKVIYWRNYFHSVQLKIQGH